MRSLWAAAAAALVLAAGASGAADSATDTTNAPPSLVDAQSRYGFFSSAAWCADQTTFVFGPRAEHRAYLSGVRLIFEPQLGTIFQRGKNQFKVDLLRNLPKFAIETNLCMAWVSLQLGLIYPSSVTFEENSAIVRQRVLKSGGSDVGVDGGVSIGLSFLDGVISFGRGRLYYDEKEFVDYYVGPLHDSFWFFNVQPASLVKSLAKRTK